MTTNTGGPGTAEGRAKPCPFCGESYVGVKDGDTFRWRHAECGHCGARGPEVRVQTLGDGTAKEWEANAQVRAVEAWNNRPEPPKDAPMTLPELPPLPHQFTRDARHLAHEARERILTAEIERLRAECEAVRAALDWIATVNAMDYEYVRVARSAIDAAREGK